MKKTIEQMEQALRDTNFYVGGLSDEGIEYYYNKMMTENKQKEEKTEVCPISVSMVKEIFRNMGISI